MRVGRFCIAFCVVAFVGAVVQGDEAVVQDENPIPYKLNLLGMMEGMGSGAGSSRVIDVGLRWKYLSATATDSVTAPKIRVFPEGSATATTSLVHVEADSATKAALFTGGDNVEVEINSRTKVPTLRMASGKGVWDISVPDENSFAVGKQGMKPTLQLADGRIGVGTSSAPKAAVHVQSNMKGDGILVQGNIDGKTDALTDAMLTLESSQDYRGRGVFMPNRGGTAGASTAWFAGVPNGGGGYQIGSSASHMSESTSGPYTKGQAHMFVTTDGKTAFGHTTPDGQVDIQLLAAHKANADRALNIRGGSINLDYSQGINSGRIGLISSEKDYIMVGSSKKTEEREIRLQTDEKNFVTVSRYNAYVGIGGVTTPTVPLEVKGNVKVNNGKFTSTMEPKAMESMMELDSKSTVPAAMTFKQADKAYMTMSAGKDGATLELANGAALTVANGKMGVGTDPTELFHINNGDMLLEGSTNLFFKSKVAGTKIYEKDGLHISGGLSGKVLLDDADLVLSNPGSDGVVDVRAGATKEAAMLLTSGADAWKASTTMAGTGALLFSHKGVQAALTRDGMFGVGIEKPTEALHISGNGLFESAAKPVFASIAAKSETQAAGVKIKSGIEEWMISATGAGKTDVGTAALEFIHGGKSHVVISKAGSLGVGTAKPLDGTALHVVGPSMFAVGSQKGKIVVSTPNSNPGLSFFDNGGYRRMDLEVVSEGLAFTSAAGKFGIGAASPKSKLHVYDVNDSAISIGRSGKPESLSYIKYSGANMKIGTAAADGIEFDVSGAPKMTIHNNGNVGVATTTPKSTLQVADTTHIYQAGKFATFGGNAYFDGAKYKYAKSGAAGALQIGQDGTVSIHTATSGASDSEIVGFSTSAFLVDSKGNVGVGAANPESALHIAKEGEAALAKDGMMMIGVSKAKKNLVFDHNTILARTNGVASPLRVNPTGGAVTFFSESTKAGHLVTFGDDANVGFGPAKPLAKLHVSEGPGRYSTIGLGESNTGIAVMRYKESKLTLGFSKSASGGNNVEDGITIMKEGNVGIGHSAPKAKLHVDGDVLVSGKLNVGGKEIVTMMEDMMKENERLATELSAAKEMLMSMSTNMQRLSEMTMQKQ